MSSKAVDCTEVAALGTAQFLLRCTRTPDRFFYPCNAKHRAPVCCAYELRRASNNVQSPSVRVIVEECQYTEGGTGWVSPRSEQHEHTLYHTFISQ